MAAPPAQGVAPAHLPAVAPAHHQGVDLRAHLVVGLQAHQEVDPHRPGAAMVRTASPIPQLGAVGAMAALSTPAPMETGWCTAASPDRMVPASPRVPLPAPWPSLMQNE